MAPTRFFDFFALFELKFLIYIDPIGPFNLIMFCSHIFMICTFPAHMTKVISIKTVYFFSYVEEVQKYLGLFFVSSNKLFL